MGAVYRAVQHSLQREVALKIISPALARDAAFAARFQREAQTLARVAHPHIVAIHDAGITPDGRAFLSMECVPGTDLARLLARNGPLRPSKALRVIRQLCEALQAAHDVGVVHRDVKPSNILLTPQNQVKLADFGIAASVGLTGAESLPASCLGTPDYLPPEALLPGYQPTVQSDIFAAGVTLYETLTGRLPLRQFPLASQLVPQLDGRIDAIIDKAMCLVPAGRYSSAAAMADALAALESSMFPRGFRHVLLASMSATHLAPGGIPG
jgi:serine/threonine protein kinase